MEKILQSTGICESEFEFKFGSGAITASKKIQRNKFYSLQAGPHVREKFLLGLPAVLILYWVPLATSNLN